MAGLPNALNPQAPANTQEAQQQVSVLEEARGQLRGVQKESLRDLFSYDKSLSDRYSDPGSKMYIESAVDREKAISGYSTSARKDIDNLFDLMESVRKAEDNLKGLIEKMKGGSSGSGTGVILDDLLNSVLTEDVPNPPQKVLDAAKSQPDKTIYYMKNDDGTYAYELATTGAPSRPELKEWSPGVGRTKMAQDMFGIDQATLAKLAFLKVHDPKLAQKYFNALISNSIMAPERSSDTTDDYIKQIKNYRSRQEAADDINRLRTQLTAQGIDVSRLERAVDQYFTEQEQKGSDEGVFDIKSLKEKRGGGK